MNHAPSDDYPEATAALSRYADARLCSVPLDATILSPEQYLAYWNAMEDATQAGDSYRTYRRKALRYTRLVVPIPYWVAQLLGRMGLR